MMNSQSQRRVVIVGAGFAGFNAARELSRRVGAATDIMVINSADYFLYLPLMPQVAGGLVEPRHVCVSLPRRLRRVQFVLGTVQRVDGARKVVSWASAGARRLAPERSHALGNDIVRNDQPESVPLGAQPEPARALKPGLHDSVPAGGPQ